MAKISKTVGAVDKIPKRKRRSDRNKHRKKYAGRPVKRKRKIRGRYVPYESLRRKGSPLKVYFFKVDVMSNEGYFHFPKDTRAKIWKYVYGRNGARVRVDLSEEQLSTKENISSWCSENLWEGSWHLRLWTHKKNLYHCSARTVATIKLTNSADGLRCKVYPSHRGRSLRRYSFWKDD